MTHFSDKLLIELKQTISLQRLVESSGIALKKHGKDYHGHCPFHDDKTPSLVISPDKNLWHCLGACQTGGDVISWVMKSQGMSFRHAVALLHDGDFNHLAANPVKKSSTTKLPSLLDASVEDQVLLMQVIDYYHTTLKQNPEALSYLDKRGLNHPELIDHFKLGVANRSLAYRLPEKNRKAGAEIRARLQALGILRDSGHEHLNGSLVIPVINQAQVLEVYGRKLKNNLRKGTAYHLYLPGPHQGIFNLEAIKNSEEVILCESLIDALTFWSAGYRNVTASYGIEGFTDHHLAAFKQYQTKRVLIAYDRDAAGDKAALSLAAKLMKEGIDCYRIQFPKGMDANEYALQVQPASKSLGIAIRSAEWLGQGEAPARAAEPAIESILVDEVPEPVAEPDIVEPIKPLPASVMPSTAKDIEAEISEQEVIITLGDRRYRIRGLSKNLSINQLKVNVLVSKGEALHVDTFDLYAAKSRGLFIKQVALELNIEASTIKTDLGKILLKLESLQEQQIEQTLNTESTPTQLNTAEKVQALDLLKSPKLIQPYLVANPFAEQLTFIDDKTRTRRDHLKYLTLINSIALLHQYQREIKTIMHDGQVLEYIEVTPQDIKTANQLAHEVLGRSLNELPPQTLTLLKHIQEMVKKQGSKQSIEQADYRFSRKDIREYTGFGNTQLKVHLGRLEDLEYLLIHQGSRGKSLVYELLYDGELDDKKHLMGLIDPESLHYDDNKSGDNAQLSGPSRPQVTPKSAGSRSGKNKRKVSDSKAFNDQSESVIKKALQSDKTNGTSYRSCIGQ